MPAKKSNIISILFAFRAHIPYFSDYLLCFWRNWSNLLSPLQIILPSYSVYSCLQLLPPLTTESESIDFPTCYLIDSQLDVTPNRTHSNIFLTFATRLLFCCSVWINISIQIVLVHLFRKSYKALYDKELFSNISIFFKNYDIIYFMNYM